MESAGNSASNTLSGKSRLPYKVLFIYHARDFLRDHGMLW